MMNSGRFIFDSPHQGSSNMILLGNRNPTIFQGARLLNMDGGANRRRPFFTLPEEMLEEEYYDEQQPEKKRRLTLQQVDMLERSFETENKLEPDRKSELALKLGLQPRQVAVWFQNRRARWKTKQLEGDFDRLKASYEALAADHDALLKDNDRLRSQVFSLTEKLQTKEPAEAGGTALKQGNSAVAGESALHGQQKVEDRLSAGSAVVDEEGLVDRSGNSYLQESYQGGCAMGIQSEEDDGCSYLPGDMFTDSNNNEGWWVWN